MKISAVMVNFEAEDPTFQPKALHYTYCISVGGCATVYWHLYRHFGSDKALSIYNPHLSQAVSDALAAKVLGSVLLDGAPCHFVIEKEES